MLISTRGTRSCCLPRLAPFPVPGPSDAKEDSKNLVPCCLSPNSARIQKVMHVVTSSVTKVHNGALQLFEFILEVGGNETFDAA
jgi:hypothetical protein